MMTSSGSIGNRGVAIAVMHICLAQPTRLSQAKPERKN
jgi:hypothetical protein